MAGWSSLHADLVNRIADCLLATDDLDYYMDLRAVCRGWRSSTADPKNRPRDPRFRPRQWAMLDEVHQSDERLFVNAGTGRFVRRDLPLLRRYFVVAGAGGGSVVLAERTAPHAARVLNPFTGAMVSFEAPVPSEMQVAAHVIGSSPTLVLLSLPGDSRTIYWADPDSKSFEAHKAEHSAHPLIRMALEGGVYAAAAAARESGPLPSFLVPEADKILNLAARPFAQYFAGGNNRCFLVESAGEMLVVLKLPHRVEVFKIDTGSSLLERVKNLGRRALFVGKCRCLSVDADKFASVEANCIYYMGGQWCDVCVYSLKDETEVRAGRAIDSFKPMSLKDETEVRAAPAIDSFNPFTLSVDPPFSEVELLCSYTFEVRFSQLQWHQWVSSLEGIDDVLPPQLLNDLYDSDDFSDIFT